MTEKLSNKCAGELRNDKINRFDFSGKSQTAGWKSAYLNLTTARHDLEAAQDEIATGHFDQAMESLRFAMQQIESAQSKISNDLHHLRETGERNEQKKNTMP